MNRGRYFTIAAAAADERWSGVYTERYLRRLVSEKRIAVHRPPGSRKVLIAEADLEAFLEAGREEPFTKLSQRGRAPATTTGARLVSLSSDPPDATSGKAVSGRR